MFTDVNSSKEFEDSREITNVPKIKKNLKKVLKSNQYSLNSSAIQNEPFKLPQFAKSKDRTINDHTEVMNSNMLNKNNKMISIDGIRERSENRKNLISEQRIDVQC